MNKVFIAGCGYVGRHLLAQLPPQTPVTALTHSAAHATELRELGITPVLGDLDDDSAPDLSATADALLFYFVPPPPVGTDDPRLARFLAALPPTRPPRKIVLISATGVYGDCRGDWVDESRPPAPDTDRGRRRLHAEQTLRRWCQPHDVDFAILRVAGIYGPGRLPRKRLEQGAPVLREQDAPFSNRIHIHDLIRSCLAAAEFALPDGLCNISDGHPSTMTDYFLRVAEALGLPRPPTITRAAARSQMSPGMLSYLRESRRLDNRRMREVLGVEPIYADLGSGLSAGLRADPSSGLTV